MQSHSRLGCFEQCPKRFRYRYVDKRPEGFTSIEAFMGTVVHATLETVYAGGPFADLYARKGLGALYVEHWTWLRSHAKSPIRVIKDGDRERDYEYLGFEMLERYMAQRYSLTNHEYTVGVECKVGIQLGEDQYVGYIDRLAYDPIKQRFVIIDYKTGKRALDRFEGKEADQLRSYGAGLMLDLEHVHEVDLRLEFLRHGKAVSSTISREGIAAVLRKLRRKVSDQEAATDYPALPGPLCRWCGYNDICEDWKKGAEPEAPF